MRYSIDELLAFKDSPQCVAPKDMVIIDDWLQSVRDESMKQSKAKVTSNTTASDVVDDIILGPPKTSFASSTAHSLRKDDDRGGVAVGLIRGDGHRGEGRGDLRNDGRGELRGDPRAKKSLRNNSEGWTNVSRGARKASFFEDGGKQRQKYNHFTQRRADRPERVRPEWMESGLGEKMKVKNGDVPVEKDSRQHSVEEFEAWKATMRAQDNPHADDDKNRGDEGQLRTSQKTSNEEIVDSFQSLWAKEQGSLPADNFAQVENESQRKPSRPSRFSTLFSPAPTKSPEAHMAEPRPAVPPETHADKEAFQRILKMLDGPASGSSVAPPPPPVPAPRRRANPQANQEFLLSLMNGAKNQAPAESSHPVNQHVGATYGYTQHTANGGQGRFIQHPSAPPGITHQPISEARVSRPPPGLKFPPGFSQ